MSGKKRITVDEDAWNEAMRKGGQLAQLQRDLPGMLEAVRQAHEQQAGRDRAEFQARQDELNGKLAALSSRARELEQSTSRRISAATATIMNEARKANEQVRSETRQLVEREGQRLDSAIEQERAERARDIEALQDELAADRAARADLLAAARTTLADARVLLEAIDSTLPHRRFAPGRLDRLARTLANAEANAAAGAGEAALANVQELYLDLDDLHVEVEYKDAQWRSAHLTAVTMVTALIEQISRSERIDVTDEETGGSAELDVDFWSDGALAKIKAAAGRLGARVADEADPPSLADLTEMSERTVASLEQSLSEVVAMARARQWASQVRVNVAERVVQVLEDTTGFALEGDPIFAGDDQRAAFYAKLASPDESEIVVEVAPDETGRSCVIRVLSYEAGTPNEYLRAARVRTVTEALRAQGLSGSPAAEPGEPEQALRDFARLRREPAPIAVPGRA